MRNVATMLASVALCACVDGSSATEPRLPAARGTRLDAAPDARAGYTLVRLRAFESSPNRGSAIAGGGRVAGYTTTPNGERHATLWRGETPTDLGTLGGPHSTVQWAAGLSDAGVVVGIAQTAAPDPLGEDWSCSAFFPSSGNVCLGFAWLDGAMTPLPTLGGTNGYAAGVNDRAQVVGWAETAVHDPTCVAPQVLQFRAVLWDARRGTKRELPPLAGDSTSAATAINGRGQAVGISGDCDVAVGRFSAKRMVLWVDRVPTEIPNLGGEAWHTPTAISEVGHVVGFSNPPGVTGGALLPHAFLWTKAGGLVDLGTLPGDDNSQAFGVNARGQVVGVSCLGGACRAMLWENGVMKDLKTLLGPGFADDLLSARDIDDAGEITGNVRDHVTGRIFAFVATPTRR
jgi:probable HAF family extracellular repeat protein